MNENRQFNAPTPKAPPSFNNLLAVLQKKAPDRPTLFEFFMNNKVYVDVAGEDLTQRAPGIETLRRLVHVFHTAGYDYTTCCGSEIAFPRGDQHVGGFRAGGGTMIRDRTSFDAYDWPDPDACDYSMLDAIADDLPDGMKIIVYGPGGVLENVISLVGFETMCYMIADDCGCLEDIFERIGSILVRHYEIGGSHDTVGACISNDDWGFKTQPMLSPEDMHRFVVPQHKRIVETIHKIGKPAILHSCGNQASMMDTIIEELEYDGKHSYEDQIQPVEEAYEQYGSRIAILGGIDLDFVCRSTPQQVYERAKRMLERTASRGGYALGTGNSVPEYVPLENYYALLAPALETR